MTDLVGPRDPGQRGQPRTSLGSRAPPRATQRLENLVPCPARPCTRPAAEVLCAAQFGLRRSRACQRATASVRADRLGATPASPGHWCDLGRGRSGPGPTWPGAGGENVSTQGLFPIAPAVRVAPSESDPSGARAVSRELVPRLALSVPLSRRRSTARRPSQYPHGSQAVSTPSPDPADARRGPTSVPPADPRHQRLATHPRNVSHSGPSAARAIARPPRVAIGRPTRDLCRALARPGGLHRASESAGSRSRPRPAPPPLGATCTGHEVGLGAEWRGVGDRRSLLSNRLAAARAQSWRRMRRGVDCPAAGPCWPWDILERRRDPRVAAGDRRRGEACARAIAACTIESRPPALGASERAQRGADRGGPRRPLLRSRERASERIVCERLRGDERPRPRMPARRLSRGRPALQSRQARRRIRPGRGHDP